MLCQLHGQPCDTRWEGGQSGIQPFDPCGASAPLEEEQPTGMGDCARLGKTLGPVAHRYRPDNQGPPRAHRKGTLRLVSRDRATTSMVAFVEKRVCPDKNTVCKVNAGIFTAALEQQLGFKQCE